jgi:hypothetical protein
MRFYIDAEFWERGPNFPIQLISIAIHADSRVDLYLINEDFNWEECNSEWLHQNVKPHLDQVVGVYAKHADMAKIILDYVRRETCGSKPEFWGYYSDYDWVVFCQIFGSMINLPEGFPMYCLDIKQLCVMVGNPTLPKQAEGEHNALLDARWNRKAYYYVVAQAARE